MARDKRRRPGDDQHARHAPHQDTSPSVTPRPPSCRLPQRGNLLLLLFLVVGVGRHATASRPAAAFLLGSGQHALGSRRPGLSWRKSVPGPAALRIPSLRRAQQAQRGNDEEDETAALARRLFEQSGEAPSPPPPASLSSTKPTTTATTRSRGRAAASTTRRDQLVTGGLLAGVVTATLLNLPPAGRMAQAAMSTPLYVDKEVWAPLENYMQMDGRERQTTYSPKFTAYLARLLINYDYASMSWWQRKTLLAPRESSQRINRLLSTKGFEGTFRELDLDEDTFISQDELRAALSDPEELARRERELLAQLQASVNFGLVRYQGREGVDRLCRILRSEFGINRLGKRQLAMLFALMDNLQPVEAIKQLIAEAENASVVGFNVTYPGFGYDAENPPTVTVSPSPGANATVQARVKLAPTGRILKVVLDSPMTGFSTPPKLEVSPPIAEGGVRAVCIPKMNGDTLERIVLSNPGKGYSEVDRVSIIVNAEGQPLPWVLRQARPLLEMKVAAVELVDKVKGGEGYAHDLPIKVEISKPPFPVSAVATAKATALLSEPKELILRSWLPPTNATIPVTGLLPNNLVPKYDPCLERFIISPVEELDPNYCIYFEDEFKVVPSQKFSKYFSFLDGPKARDPVEKERELDATVFWRFAMCGALCCSTAHAFLIPLDVVKTKMQASPSKYPSFVSATRRIVDEGGPSALLLGAGPTVLGYLVYGAVSFGLTEYFKRVFLDLAGPEYATFYPFAILLLASMSAAFFGAVAVTPFEALRIRSVTSSENGANEEEDAVEEALRRLESNQSVTSLEDTTRVMEELEPEIPPPPPTAMEMVAAEAEEEAPPQNLEGLVSVLASAAVSSVQAAATNGVGGLGGGEDDNKENSSSSTTSSSSSISSSVGSGASVGGGGAATATMQPALGMVATVGQMLKEGNIGELYAGLGPAVVGEIPFMMAKFAVFDAVSKAIYAVYPTASESVALSLSVSLLSGMTAGVAAAAVSQPFDTLTTKVTQYSQMKREGGIVAAVKEIYGKGGLTGFFKGTFPRAVKSAANIALQFFLYDFSKRALHVSADDLKLFFDVMSGLSQE